MLLFILGPFIKNASRSVWAILLPSPPIFFVLPFLVLTVCNDAFPFICFNKANKVGPLDFIHIWTGVTSPFLKLSFGFNIRVTGISSWSANCWAAISEKGFKSFKVMLSKSISPNSICSLTKSIIGFTLASFVTLKGSIATCSEASTFTGSVISTVPADESFNSLVLNITSPSSLALSYILSRLSPSLRM